MTRDPYLVLEVDRDADAAALKSAWRKASRRTHPDVGGDAAAFQEVQEAWALLGDPDARARFDAGATAGATAGAPADATAPGTGPGQETAPRGAEAGQRAAHRARAGSWAPQPKPTMTVDPQHLSWVGRRVDPQVQVLPRTRPWLRHVPVAAGSAAVLAWAVLLYRMFTPQLPTPAPADIGGMLLLGVFTVALLTRWWPASAVVAGVGVGAGWFGYATVSALDVACWVVALAAGAGALAARTMLLISGAGGLDEVLDEKAATSFNVFGTPGAPGHVDTGDTRVAARMGDDALLTLTWFPGARTFHAAPFDKAGRATSHVVVCGSRVAVVETVTWLPGVFAFSPTGAVTCDGGHFVYGDTVIADAVAAWSQRVPKGTQVRGWVMVGSPVGPVTIAFPDGPGGLRVGTPHQVVDEVGTWFADGDPTVVDRRVLAPFARALTRRPG